MRATYCGLMSEIDDQLGRVFDYLKETGQWDDTLIVFTCDHGEQLGDHHLLGKIGYFDEMLPHPDDRARSARRGERHARHASSSASPRRSTPCRRSSNGSACRVPRQCDGRSLLPFCAGRAAGRLAHRGALRVRLPRPLLLPARNRRSACRWTSAALAVVQDEHYKYVHFAALPPLFFDLEARPRPVREPRRRSGLCRARAATMRRRC